MFSRVGDREDVISDPARVQANTCANLSLLLRILGYAQLTKQLMDVAGGQVVMALEGGYSLPSLCDAAEACVNALLGEKVNKMVDRYFISDAGWSGQQS